MRLVIRFVTVVVFVTAMGFSSVPVYAQDAGIRGGISISPDQFYFGGHIETSPLVDRLYFRPNVELGINDDLMLIGANMEFVYKFFRRSGWSLYAGGGPALNIFMADDADSDVDAGFNVLFGAERSGGLFFEVKVGAIDSPDFKFGVGYTWR